MTAYLHVPERTTLYSGQALNDEIDASGDVVKRAYVSHASIPTDGTQIIVFAVSGTAFKRIYSFDATVRGTTYGIPVDYTDGGATYCRWLHSNTQIFLATNYAAIGATLTLEGYLTYTQV